jgi:hypothetical protein
MWHFYHAYLAQSAYRNLSRWLNRVGQIHCSRERGTLDYIPTTPAGRSTGLHPISLLLTAIEVVCLSQASVEDSLLVLLGPYLQYAINTFNTCSRIPTHRSLINTDRGYNLRDAGFSHYFPRPSQPTVLYFSLRALLGLRLITPT